MTGIGWSTLVSSLLAQGTPVRFTAPGRSMAPTIADGETITVWPLDENDRPARGEVVLAQVADRLVAHRIIEIRPAAQETWFVLRGDAQGQATDIVPRRAILGRVLVPQRVCRKPFTARERLATAVQVFRQRCTPLKTFFEKLSENIL